MGEAIDRVNYISFSSDSEEETLCIGRKFGAALTRGAAALLVGGLGAGKTVLVRGVGDALGAARVRSPSFTLINEYRCEKFTVVHADLYRLDDASELALEEYLDDNAVLLVEWPERWKNPPADAVKINFETTESEPNKRLIRFSAFGKKSLDILDSLKGTLP
ncbi:tRNA (adenosine(37)-N6)-threonylcarbamoyltransferase complex ATPase subunit type 1 TsaE [Synergistales bacterium]|nr:tRNA (adenosine(37)-N6)-threonylcarbamoyltransferase complex ATPase subunit type 1 TsaE [Synergistales bacterium]